jgi:hypothetical protein
MNIQILYIVLEQPIRLSGKCLVMAAKFGELGPVISVGVQAVRGNLKLCVGDHPTPTIAAHMPASWITRP